MLSEQPCEELVTLKEDLEEEEKDQSRASTVPSIECDHDSESAKAKTKMPRRQVAKKSERLAVPNGIRKVKEKRQNTAA